MGPLFRCLPLLSLAGAASLFAADARENPFFHASPLQYETPAFDTIRDADYQPALEEGMKRQLAEIDAIANDPAPATFENTLVAMEKSGQLLNRVSKVFFSLIQSNTDDALQKVRAEEAPKLSAHQDAIFQNPKLWARVKSLWDRRDALGLDAEGRYLLEQYRKSFVRAGADLSADAQSKVRALNSEEAKLQARYAELLLAGNAAAAIVVSDRRELAGLTDAEVAAAAARAKERKLDGKWVFDLQNTTQQPVLASLSDRALRERILRASEHRCDEGANDTRATSARLAQLRAERAKLLGFATHADFVLDNQMARTPDHAMKLLTDMVPAATAKARREAARLQQLIDSDGAARGGFELSASDWEIYSGRVQQADFQIDPAEVKPYFTLDRALNDGVFYAANRLYGLTFKERKDLPKYAPDVRVFEVFDADGKSLALFYGDYFQRTNKGGGAWCDTLVDQSALFGTHPVVVNVLNFPKPAPGTPAFLTFDDVTVLFHEFGHALHAMFSTIRYPTLASTPNDWAEMPSQFNEHWALDPDVLAHYARHVRTGAPLPAALVEKIRRAKTFNQGYMTTEYLAAALLDLAWHTLPADAPLQDVDAFEKAALARFHVDLAQVPPRYRTNYFSHIWDLGYSANYYAYLWAEVIDDDAYAWFKEHGGMTRENGQRFREMLLSREGTADVAELYRAFRGRDPVVQPLLEERGLVGEAPAAGQPGAPSKP
ncbi:MAG: M3 family metallopeptidase [Thermoanaerobaculia bacterium]